VFVDTFVGGHLQQCYLNTNLADEKTVQNWRS